MGEREPLVLMRFPEAAEGFLAWLRAKKLSAHTIRGYESDLRIVAEIAAGAAGVVVEELEVRHLSGRLVRCAFAEFADPRSAASVNRAWSAWNQLFGFCVAEGLLEGNPMAAVPGPSSRPRLPSLFWVMGAPRSPCWSGSRPGPVRPVIRGWSVILWLWRWRWSRVCGRRSCWG